MEERWEAKREGEETSGRWSEGGHIWRLRYCDGERNAQLQHDKDDHNSRPNFP